MTVRSSWVPAAATEHCVALVGGAQALRDEAARVGAAAGVVLVQADSVAQALQHNPAVLLLTCDSANAALPADTPVILIGGKEDEGAVWAAASRAGAGRVAILPQAASWLAEHLSGAGSAARSGTVVGIMGASGGAGATTLGCWLADHAGTGGMRTVLIDGDPGGGGLGLALGGAAGSGACWDDLAEVRGALHPGQFAAALPQTRNFAVLSQRTPGIGAGTPPAGRARPGYPGHGSEAVASVLAAARDAYDLAVVDLGAAHAAGDSLSGYCQSIIVVVPARPRPVSAAGRILPLLEPSSVELVVRGPVLNGLDPDRIAEALSLPRIPAFLPRLRAVPAAEAQERLLELGHRRGPRRVCATLASRIWGRPAAG